jgi:HPt (histidine-containing phosphotransfer) domain-containing protein
MTLAHRLVHTLKSNAGFIGKTKLQKAATEVENALKNGDGSETIMNIFRHELNKVLDELKPFLEAALNSAPLENIGEPLDAEAADALLTNLELFLSQGSPECLRLADELRRVPGSEKLIAQMEDFYFGDASKTLIELKESRKKQGGNHGR